MEAKHQFEEFQKAAPADPRVAVLGALLR
jgi:hypothetical protein